MGGRNGLLVCGCGYSSAFAFFLAAAEDAVGHFANHFAEEQPEVAAFTVIGRGNVFDPPSMGAELEAFAETSARFIVGIVNGDRLSAVTIEHGETGDIGGAITYVDHIFKRDGAEFGGHVIIDILVVAEHAFVDTEEELRLGGVGDGTLGEADAAIAIFAEFAAKDGLHVRVQAGAIEECL